MASKNVRKDFQTPLDAHIMRKADERRVALGWSWADLSRKTSRFARMNPNWAYLCPSRLSKYRAGTGQVKARELITLARALGVPETWLTGTANHSADDLGDPGAPVPSPRRGRPPKSDKATSNGQRMRDDPDNRLRTDWSANPESDANRRADNPGWSLSRDQPARRPLRQGRLF
jgi:transcriptional regulator with XRE-family HTH domain